MRKVLAAVLAVALLAAPAAAENWTEVDVAAFVRTDGSFQPEASISILNYIADKGVGLWVGQDNSAGPLVSWRVWQHGWDFGMENAVHLIGGSDLLTQGSSTFDNANYGVDIRWGWTGAADIKISTKLTWTSVEGGPTLWTPSIGIVLQPGAGND